MSDGPGGQSFELRHGDATYTTTFESNGRYTDSRGIDGTWSLAGNELQVSATDAGGADASFSGPWVRLGVGESSAIDFGGGVVVNAKRIK